MPPRRAYSTGTAIGIALKVGAAEAHAAGRVAALACFVAAFVAADTVDTRKPAGTSRAAVAARVPLPRKAVVARLVQTGRALAAALPIALLAQRFAVPNAADSGAVHRLLATCPGHASAGLAREAHRGQLVAQSGAGVAAVGAALPEKAALHADLGGVSVAACLRALAFDAKPPVPATCATVAAALPAADALAGARYAGLT